MAVCGKHLLEIGDRYVLSQGPGELRQGQLDRCGSVIGARDAGPLVRRVGIHDQHRIDLGAAVVEVHGEDVQRERHHPLVRPGHLDEDVPRIRLHLADLGAVDDGREGQHAVHAVNEDRVFLEGLHDAAVLDALGMPFEDLAERELFVHAEGRERQFVGRGKTVIDGEGDLVHLVDADGDGASLPAEDLRKLVLALDHLGEDIVVHPYAEGDAGGNVRTDRFHVLRYFDDARRLMARLEKRILFRFAGQGNAYLARDTFGAPQVGPVAVRQLDLQVVGPGVVLLQLRLGQHETLFERFDGQFPADERIEVFLS